jgi:16S rRNA (guanine966-N2)-methyltransferase
MRIVGGRFKGRTLAAPSHAGTRPTSDRVRESVFNILLHGLDAPPLEGAQVIDLFAGTGALGFEALSRGAAYALFVEDNADARGLIRRNVEDFGLQGVTRIFRRDATKLGPASARDRYEYAFLDPPYGKELGEAALASLRDGNWLAPGAIAILEERAGIAIALPAGFELLEQRTYGDTTVHFMRLTAETP